jgi:hypothetical protein
MDVRRPAQDSLDGDDLLRRILQTQRTIVEQNAKILEGQKQQREANENNAGEKMQVPLAVKVSAAN